MPLLSSFVCICTVDRSEGTLPGKLRIGWHVNQIELILAVGEGERLTIIKVKGRYFCQRRLWLHVICNLINRPTEKFLAHCPVFIYLFSC